MTPDSASILPNTLPWNAWRGVGRPSAQTEYLATALVEKLAGPESRSGLFVIWG